MKTLLIHDKTIPELLDFIKDMTNEEKVNILKRYNTKDLKWCIDTIYNKDMSNFYIPEYKNRNYPAGCCTMTLRSSLNRIEAAVNTLNKDDNKKVYERLISLVLEEVSNDEAKLLELVLTGKKIPNISKSIWRKVFPEFFRVEETN